MDRWKSLYAPAFSITAPAQVSASGGAAKLAWAAWNRAMQWHSRAIRE